MWIYINKCSINVTLTFLVFFHDKLSFLLHPPCHYFFIYPIPFLSKCFRYFTTVLEVQIAFLYLPWFTLILQRILCSLFENRLEVYEISYAIHLLTSLEFYSCTPRLSNPCWAMRYIFFVGPLDAHVILGCSSRTTTSFWSNV